MTYPEFVEYIRQRAHDELGFPAEGMDFFPEGYTAEKAAELEWIRESNRRCCGREADALLTDLLVLTQPKPDGIRMAYRIAIRILYDEQGKEDEEGAFQKVKASQGSIESAQVDYAALNRRGTADYEAMRGQLFLRPLNYTMHLRDLHGSVYDRFSDFALVLYQLIGDAEGSLTSSKIKRGELERWGMAEQRDKVMLDALENTARLFPASVYNYTKQEEVELLQSEVSLQDITFMRHPVLLSTLRTTNGAMALFYPGVVQKMMEIMGGPFWAVFMNINDVMILKLNDPMAKQYALTAGTPGPMGEMLSAKVYRCDAKGITIVKK